jgi:hypothetical protein
VSGFMTGSGVVAVSATSGSSVDGVLVQQGLSEIGVASSTTVVGFKKVAAGAVISAESQAAFSGNITAVGIGGISASSVLASSGQILWLDKPGSDEVWADKAPASNDWSDIASDDNEWVGVSGASQTWTNVSDTVTLWEAA